VRAYAIDSVSRVFVPTGRDPQRGHRQTQGALKGQCQVWKTKRVRGPKACGRPQVV